uniref:VLIG-type G domain-containing protein n=1 Tax=Sparus aurata TaxID=8175 RepID=A0A671U5Y7_SPAAU
MISLPPGLRRQEGSGNGQTMSTMNKEGPAVLSGFLSKLGLQDFYPNKLTLRSFLEINKTSLYDGVVTSVKEIPWCFLRKLFKINAECRSCTQLSNNDNNENKDPFSPDRYTPDDSADNKVNPLDLIVALFLCADSSLQQEMALKMSMCQFSVPLLLPNGHNSQCTLMLWALRDIVKEWRPHDLSESRGFVEDNIVQADLPFFSFVRLKNCSLSKSQILNHILSRGQLHHNMFIHRDMKGGANTRKIANGLVEVCWFLPDGNRNLDIFPKPVAFANLRGDIAQLFTQFSFLYEVSTATFVFLDKVDENEHKILTSLQDVKSKLFLVVNGRSENATKDIKSVKATKEKLDLPNSNVKIKDSTVNVAEFSENLCELIKPHLSDVKSTIRIENMPDKAVDLGLSVDENNTDKQRKSAEEIINSIGEQSIPDYKKQQLHLQGDNWKRLSKIESKKCRIKDIGDSSSTGYESQLEAEQNQIRKGQSQLKPSKAMKRFIETLSTSDKEKRDFFLKSMKFKLDTHSRDKLTELRNRFKEQCKKKDAKVIAELDRALVDSSLGIEHYMREMGLIYEFSSQSEDPADKVTHLPGLAAEMLLDGHPLELLDGDASNIPERWLTDVLMELHRKVGEKSKLLVLTVLGVQGSGKSTLLNTMFGVQFPVSSGRCTRGAYMLFLRVGEDMREEINCDFIVLIDTEGLKSPQLAQLEDSYEHDNELATFVIGMSDITIINVAMENSTEMKDVLQIAAHAFLRMKEIGKKPVCHFVHQNVAGVSAHTKNMSERKHLLDQLNEMTQIAAEMEGRPFIKKFTDVLDCDVEKNNWNIPGLWLGTPPMAPVNTGYSEVVADLKKNLLAVKSDRSDELSQIPEFLEWMRSLWKAVKYENFIFSFRNTLVAHAYDNLCKEFNQWEWEFRKEIFSWQKEAELEIFNVDETEFQRPNQFAQTKKIQALQKIVDQEKLMKQKLEEYYKSKDRHVHLIEKYNIEFFNSISGLKNEIQHSVNNKLDCALELRKSLKEVQDIQRKSRELIEEQVMKLLSDCKHRTLSEEELKHEFEKMWTEVTANVSGLEEQDISARIIGQLRKNFLNHNVSEELQNIGDLNEIGKGSFEVKTEHVKKNIVTRFLRNHILNKDTNRELQNLADGVIDSCTRFVQNTAKNHADYNDCFTNELLKIIDISLQQHKDLKLKFQIDLTLHICGIATREFLYMHRKFLAKIDPKIQLEKFKPQYLSDFLDLYKENDDCQRKASDFVQLCIRPAVEQYISRSLGTDIVDEILTSSHSAQYSSRSLFQYNIQKELLLKDDFESFVKYICKYEIYVKDWIFQHMLQKMSEDKTLCKLKNKTLKVIVQKITEATEKASKGEGWCSAAR